MSTFVRIVNVLLWILFFVACCVVVFIVAALVDEVL